MKEIKFTRNYKIDSEGNKYLYGYKCSDERFEIIKSEVEFEKYIYDVYANGTMKSWYYKLKDAKEYIYKLIYQIENTCNGIYKTEASLEDLAKIETETKDGNITAYIQLEPEYFNLRENIMEIATEENPEKNLNKLIKNLEKEKRIKVNHYVREAMGDTITAQYISPESGLRTILKIYTQTDDFGISIVDVTFDVIESNGAWDFIEYVIF